MKKILSIIFLNVAFFGHTQTVPVNTNWGCYPLDCDGAAEYGGSGAMQNGIISGALTCVTGHHSFPNTAYQFGGSTSDKIIAPTSAGWSSGTFSGWYYLTSTSTQYLLFNGVICSNTGEAWSLKVQPANVGSFYFVLSRNGNTTATACSGAASPLTVSSAPAIIGIWHHVVFTITGNDMKLWVDNILTQGPTVTSPIVNGNNQIIFGGTNQVSDAPFSGRMDDIRFFGSQLSNTSISLLNSNYFSSCNDGIGTPTTAVTVGNYCSGFLTGLTANYNVPLNTFNYNFTNASNSSSKVIIGRTTCVTGTSKLDVFDNTIGQGISSQCATGVNNIAIRGKAGDPAFTNALNIIGILGESKLSNLNTNGNAAGVVGFCGDFASSAMPQGECIGIYGNSISNGGRWAGYFDGDVRFNGTIWGSQFMWGSDKRLKTKIKELVSVTEKIKKMNGYSYLYNTEQYKNANFPETEQIGFIAQELKEIFPQLVGEDNKGFLAVNYVGFIPVLLQAHKEQQTKIEQFEEILLKQQEQIEELKVLFNSKVKNDGNDNENSGELTVTLSDKTMIVLNQNTPNPFAESTIISYYIPIDFGKAEIIFTNNDGTVLNRVSISHKGNGNLTVFASDLSKGSYTYTLVVDGNPIISKKLVKE